MLDWIPELVFLAGLLLQGMGGSALRFANPTRQQKNKWVISPNSGGITYAFLCITAEFVMYAFAWLSILPLPNAHDQFDFPSFMPPPWLVWVGIAFVLAGGLINGTARRALGENWFPGIARRKNHTIITSGPYAYVRHPMYVAYILYAVGCIIVSGCGLIVSLCALWVVGAYLRRIKYEEELLMQVKAQQYRNYISSTGALIPRLSTIRNRIFPPEDPHAS